MSSLVFATSNKRLANAACSSSCRLCRHDIMAWTSASCTSSRSISVGSSSAADGGRVRAGDANSLRAAQPCGASVCGVFLTVLGVAPRAGLASVGACTAALGVAPRAGLASVGVCTAALGVAPHVGCVRRHLTIALRGVRGSGSATGNGWLIDFSTTFAHRVSTLALFHSWCRMCRTPAREIATVPALSAPRVVTRGQRSLNQP